MYEALQFLDRTFDVIALATQQRDTLLAFLDRDQALQLAAVADVVKVDHLTDVGEAEAGALGAQYPGEPCPVPLRIDAPQTLARRADQPLVLIEAQRARGDAELGRQIGNTILLAPKMIGRVDMGVAVFV